MRQDRGGDCGTQLRAARVTEDAVGVVAVEDGCRTVGTVEGTELQPFVVVPECTATEGALLAADEPVWATEDDAGVRLAARVGDDFYDLVPRTPGTLVPCGGAAYFVRDPAQLLRWDGRALPVVYESDRSSLEPPRCGDLALVGTALSEAGDEQVMAALEPVAR